MSRYVYIARPDSTLLAQKLTEYQLPFVVKEGNYDMEALQNAWALVPGKLPVTEKEMNAAPNLRIISKYGVGLDRIDIPACTQREILVCNTPLINYVSVAEHAIALMMTVAKRIVLYDTHLQEEPEKWRRNDIPLGVELQGKTVAIIGLGRIGQYTAQLANGLGMRVIGYDPYAKKDRLSGYVTVCDTLSETLSQADFVSLHVAGTEQTKGMIGRNEFACMRPSCYLVNTTRGFVIEEAALIEALDKHLIAGAGLDVFTQEPLCTNHPLLGRDNVVVTPHIAANTMDAHARAELGTAENLRRFFDGQKPEFIANGPFTEGKKR